MCEMQDMEPVQTSYINDGVVSILTRAKDVMEAAKFLMAMEESVSTAVLDVKVNIVNDTLQELQELQ